MRNKEIGFEPKGAVISGMIRTAGLFGIAAAWLAAGIVLYITVLSKVWVILLCGGAGALFAAVIHVIFRTVYYWDDTRIAAVRPLMKPFIFGFKDIKRASEDEHGNVVLELRDTNCIVIEPPCDGLDEFKAKLKLVDN